MSEKKKEEPGDSGFKVTDKRHFTPEGEVIPGEVKEEAPAAKGAPPTPEPEKTAPPPAAAGSPAADEPPAAEKPPPGQEAPGPVDFTHLVMSLAGTAYHALGIADPVTAEKGVVNLPAASQMIDLLGIIEQKTQGNLSKQEDHILQSVLTELRSLYIQISGYKA